MRILKVAFLIVVALVGVSVRGADAATEVGLEQIQAPLYQQISGWKIEASACKSYRCEEKFGTYGLDQDIYFHASLTYLHPQGDGDYKFTKAAVRKMMAEDSYISIAVNNNSYKAKLIRTIKRKILVFHYDISDEDAVCHTVPGGGQKDVHGIGLLTPASVYGCSPSQKLGGEAYGQLFRDGAGSFGWFKVDKSLTGFHADPNIDNGLCRKPKRNRPHDISQDLYRDCSKLLALGSEITGINWSKTIPISDWEGVEREDGMGRIKWVDLAYKQELVGGKVHIDNLNPIVYMAYMPGEDHLDLERLLIPQLGIEHRKEWTMSEGHNAVLDEEGYVRCYHRKCHLPDAGAHWRGTPATCSRTPRGYVCR